jgi:hypothetical protein
MGLVIWTGNCCHDMTPSEVKLVSLLSHFQAGTEREKRCTDPRASKSKITIKMANETWLKLFPFLNDDILASQVIYMEVPVLETTIVRETSQQRNNLLFLKTPRVNSTTSKRTPPPGASRRTFGTNPLYNATKPSSRAIVTNAGYVQLYFGLTPGIFSAP